MHVVGDGEVQLAVAVVIDKGTAGAPLLSCSGDAGLVCYLFEGAIALVVEESVLAVAGDVDVVVSVVVIISDADALAPSCRNKTCLRSDVGEGAVMIVVEEVVGRFVAIVLGLGAWEWSAVDEEDVRPTVAVVVENGNAGTGGLDDVTLGLDAAVDIANCDAGLRCDIDEPGRGEVRPQAGTAAARRTLPNRG